jgi:signal transduction histidine kinase
MGAVLGNNFHNIIHLYKENLKNTVIKTIEEYQEIDLQHICTISNCSQIGFINRDKSYIVKNGILIKNEADKIINKLWDLENTCLIKDSLNTAFNKAVHKNIIITLPKYDLYLSSNSYNMLNELLKGYFFIYLIFIIPITIIFFIYELKISKQKALDVINTSSILREKNMQILTENIHHELNTPVAIIQGAVLKLEQSLKKQYDYSKSCSRVCTLTKHFENIDFGMIYSSIDQIDTVLQRMSNFKNLKYSNGNKTILDILNYSANSMSIYKAAYFEIIIDDNFSNWSLKHGEGYLKNEDLLNIISNHLRNSIEASATKINLQMKITKSKRNNSYKMMHIFITDNGTGLRDPETGLLLSPNKYQNIFKDYYSSKNKNGKSKIRNSQGIISDSLFILSTKIKKILQNLKLIPEEQQEENVRGVGLYLNKELLRDNHGDLKLRETSEKGTVFEIIVPVVKAKKGKQLR